MYLDVIIRDENGNTLGSGSAALYGHPEFEVIEARKFDNGEGVVVTLRIEEEEDR